MGRLLDYTHFTGSLILAERPASARQYRDSGAHFYHVDGVGALTTVILATVGRHGGNFEVIDSAFGPHGYIINTEGSCELPP